MNPSRIFILRPVATALLMLALLLAGLLAWLELPVAALPQVDYPTIQVSTQHPGASPEVMASAITAPLERRLSKIAGLANMSSVSSGGVSVITLQFSLDIPLDVAEQEVQAAINAANNLLPKDLPNPPIYSKVNPADTPVMSIALTSPTLPLPKLEDWADTRLAQKLSQVSGVGLVTLSGGQRPAIRIQVQPTQLASLGLSLEDLRTTINNANINTPKGSFDGPAQAASIDGNDQLKSPQEYQSLILAYKDGAPIRLGDIASIQESAENIRLAAWANTQPAIVLNIQRQPGANVIEVTDRIKALLPALTDTLPGAIDVRILSDRTQTIRASVNAVQHELILAIALVVLVIFVFLQDLRATLIPAVAVPLSLVGTFTVMYLAGFSINNLTLMALTIATGFVVDDAIVMIENIARYIENGESPLAAALKGSAQIGFTIISLTISLIAVLIPLLFMSDVIGRLFREFAVTLAVSILISAFISLTLTPMMCARLLSYKAHKDQPQTSLFEKVILQYAKLLRCVLRHQTLTLWVAVGTLALTTVLYLAIPKGFFPLQDTAAISGVSQANQSISFAGMAEKQTALTQVLLEDSAVESLSSFIGIDTTNPTLNTGRLFINLKPKAQRGSIQAVLKSLSARAQAVAGIELFLQPVQDLNIDTTLSRAQYQLTLQSADQALLSEWVPKLTAAMAAQPTLTDVGHDWMDQGLQVYLDVDRDMAARLGISPASIMQTLYNAFGQRQISTIFTQSNQYRVILEVAPNFQSHPEDLKHLYVKTASGSTVSLETLAHIQTRPAFTAFNRQAQFPTATLSFNLAPGVALSNAVQEIQKITQTLALPPSINMHFQGEALAFQASLSNTLWLILAAIITMYIVLGVLYESYIHPITILSTLPSAGIGALLALELSRQDLNIIAIIGIILLIGIVKKNAIMMIDFALDAQRTQGMAPEAAIYQACLLRFRPILMTTLAALLGALPLMLGSGMGSELRSPLGITMVGGLLVSQVLTIFTTPVIYLAFERLSARLRRLAPSLAQPTP